MKYLYILIISSIFFKMFAFADDLASDFASHLANFSKHGIEIIPGAWILYIPAGFEVAKRIADDAGFQNIYEIPGLNLFRLYDLKSPTEESEEQIFNRLTKVEEIKYMAPSTRREMQVQSAPDYYYCAAVPQDKHYFLSYAWPFYSDPLYNKQWYLQNCPDLTRQNNPLRYDMRILQAWNEFKVTGKGIVVISVDCGVYIKHEELKKRISLNFSKNHINGKDDPTPLLEGCGHGTKCAGIIAAEANNDVCGVGIAPQVTIGGHNVYSKEANVDDVHVAEAFSYKVDKVHIISYSMNNREVNAYMSEHPAILHAMVTGIQKGRRKKGVIYSISSGNHRHLYATCSTDAALQTIYSIVIGGATNTGAVPYFAEGCPAVIVATHSGNEYPYTYVTPDLNSPYSCREDAFGTSMGNAVATGIIALLLQANNNLSWRDVKYAIAWTSEVIPLVHNRGWIRNGAGFYVHFDFGFGLINAYELIKLGKNFPETVPPMNTCVINSGIWIWSQWSKQWIFLRDTTRISEVLDRQRPMKFAIPVTGCQGAPQEVNYIEHVQLTVTIQHANRGVIQIFLTSPQGTKTTILPKRPNDKSSYLINDYTFLSVHNWGERPHGNWIVDIMDTSEWGSSHQGTISKLELTLHGPRKKPKLYANGSREYPGISGGSRQPIL